MTQGACVKIPAGGRSNPPLAQSNSPQTNSEMSFNYANNSFLEPWTLGQNMVVLSLKYLITYLRTDSPEKKPFWVKIIGTGMWSICLILVIEVA